MRDEIEIRAGWFVVYYDSPSGKPKERIFARDQEPAARRFVARHGGLLCVARLVPGTVQAVEAALD